MFNILDKILFNVLHKYFPVFPYKKVSVPKDSPPFKNLSSRKPIANFFHL